MSAIRSAEGLSLATVPKPLKDLTSLTGQQSRYIDTLSLLDEREAAKLAYLMQTSPYGRCAFAKYRAFIVNPIVYSGFDEAQELEWRGLIASLAPVAPGETALLDYLCSKIMLQGGVAFYVDFNAEAGKVKLIDIPLCKLNQVITTSGIHYQTSLVNVDAYNQAAGTSYEYASQIPCMHVWLHSIDPVNNKAQPFFSAASKLLYIDQLWTQSKVDLITRQQYKPLAHVREGVVDERLLEIGNLVPPAEGVVVGKALLDQHERPYRPSPITEPGEVDPVAIGAGFICTRGDVDIKSFTQIDPNMITNLGKEVRAGLAAALRVPAFLLETESGGGITIGNQNSSEMALFIETASEIREFVSEILNSIVDFVVAVDPLTVPESIILPSSIPADYSLYVQEPSSMLEESRLSQQKSQYESMQAGVNLLISMIQGGFVPSQDFVDRIFGGGLVTYTAASTTSPAPL